MSLQRQSYLDIARAILIILVVVGHASGFPWPKYIFWFHMPAFFFLSGLLQREVTTQYELIGFIKKKSVSLLICYFSYGLLFVIFESLLFYYSKNESLMEGLKHGLVDLLYGGSRLKGSFAVFWFVTCLLLSQSFFAVIQLFIKDKTVVVLILIACFIVAHVLSYYGLSDVDLFWNVDSVLIALPFVGMGYFSKDFIYTFIKSNYVYMFYLAGVLLITLDARSFFHHVFDLKYGYFQNPVLDLFIPLIFIVIVIHVSYFLSGHSLRTALIYIGTYSIAIMYLHMFTNIYGKIIFGSNYHWIIFTILGIGVALGFSWIAEKFRWLRILFLGKIS